jgi:chromosomal replication initiator protein
MTDPDRQLWGGMLAHLRRHHVPLCRQWFEELEPLGVSSGALNLRSASNVHRDYLRRACADAFNDAALVVSGRLLSVRFLGPEDDVIVEPKRHARPGRETPDAAAGHAPHPGVRETPAAPDAEAPGRPGSPAEAAPSSPTELPTSDPRPEAELPDRRGAGPLRSPPEPIRVPTLRGGPRPEEALTINPDNSFDTFVVGPGNRLAHAAAVAVAGSPGKGYNPLFLHGGVGLGKTHLLQAVCLKILEARPDAVLYYLSCESFISQFMEAVQAGEMSSFRHRFRDVDVLIIDDIHFLAKRDRTQEEFFHTFNTLYQANKQIVLSSDAAPEEIPDLEDRLVSRFMWGLVIKIDKPDFETRAAIVKTKARLRGISIPDDVANFIAARVESNIRELEGAITRLHIQSAVENEGIDLRMARRCLGEPEPSASAEPTIQIIQNVVTDFYGVRLLDLQSKRRQRSVALPRQVCMALARKHTRLSLEEIGGHFGNRDHTTVMHAIKTIDARRTQDNEFAAVFKALEDRLRPGRTAGA